MIRSITLKFGRSSAAKPAVLATTPVTVFVGPNNSGKSRVLQEVHRWCTSGLRNLGDVIVEAIDFESPTESPEAVVDVIQLPPKPGETLSPEHIFVGRRGSRRSIHRPSLVEAIRTPNANLEMFCRWFLAHETMILDGKNRIALVGEQGAGDLQQPASSSFQVLFKDDSKRAQMRRIIHDALGMHMVIDPTKLGSLRLRLSRRAPSTVIEERGVHDEAVRFHAEADSIDQASDGVKAFAGMLTEIIAGDPRVLLIDEPEAFLHPALAASLGKEVAVTSAAAGKRLFVSTHSPNFVMGCIQSGAPVTIVRLTYRDGSATARVLEKGQILQLMRNPLLRSTGVLSGLFYECVVVAESDADRAFYQEVNERLLRQSPERGIPNCLFLNAQNKQTIQTIIRPLRDLGIPAAGIVDVDVLKDGGATWSGFLDGGYVPEVERLALAASRSALLPRIVATGRDMKREGGIGLLTGEDQESAANLCDRLDEYGLFVVRGGELESWLKHLGAQGHGPQWLISVFERMGEDPAAAGYVAPTSGDVWDFMASVRKWAVAPNRKGIPT